MNNINFSVPPCDWRELPITSLAWIGDSVYDLAMRLRLLSLPHIHSGKLHGMATHLVSAKAQAALLKQISADLSETETAIAKRGRNHHTTSVSKNANLSDYRDATALETLIGYYALNGNQERIDWIVEQGWSILQNET